MRKALHLAVITLLAGLATPLHADVVESTPSGFLLRHIVVIASPPARVYAALGEIGHWWNSEHTWSGDAANLSLDLRVGGCFCEKLPDGGGVQHLTVVFTSPGKLLRLSGALGPLQGEALAGVQTWSLKAKDQGTELTLSYEAGGYAKGGNAGASWAAPVDGVLLEQVTRLKRYVETGKPEAAKP